jgi:hypothetical protein
MEIDGKEQTVKATIILSGEDEELIKSLRSEWDTLFSVKGLEPQVMTYKSKLPWDVERKLQLFDIFAADAIEWWGRHNEALWEMDDGTTVKFQSMERKRQKEKWLILLEELRTEHPKLDTSKFPEPAILQDKDFPVTFRSENDKLVEKRRIRDEDNAYTDKRNRDRRDSEQTPEASAPG